VAVPLWNSVSSVVKVGKFLSFCDFAGTQAAGADAYALTLARNLGVNRTQINVPAPLGHVVSVADVVSRLRPLAADFAYLCHDRFRSLRDLKRKI
jgi:hypothetical protein